MATIIPAPASVPAGTLAYMPMTEKRGYVKASGQKVPASELPGLAGVIETKNVKIGPGETLYTFSSGGDGGPFAVTQDGKYAALAGRFTGQLDFIDLETSTVTEITSVPLGDFDSVDSLAFSHDGAWLSVVGDNGAHIVNVPSLTIAQEVSTSTPSAAVFNGNSSFYAVSFGGTKTVEIYNTSNWQIEYEVTNVQPATSMSFSPFSGYLAILSSAKDTNNNALTVALMGGQNTELSKAYVGFQYADTIGRGFVSFNSAGDKLIAGVYRPLLNDPNEGKSVEISVGDWVESELSNRVLVWGEFAEIEGSEVAITLDDVGELEIRDPATLAAFDSKDGVANGIARPAYSDALGVLLVDESNIKKEGFETGEYYALPNVPGQSYGTVTFNAFIKV